MKKLIIFYILLVFTVFANAQTIPKSIDKSVIPKTQKTTPKSVVTPKPVYIEKNKDSDSDGLIDEIDECPDVKGTPKNNGCPEPKVSKPFIVGMVWLAGGDFVVDNKEFDNGVQKILHQNLVVNAFFISKYEVTVAEYKSFCLATSTAMPPAPKWGWYDKHPIVNISWNDATAYCKWLSTIKGKNYRLPTEAEWEYAALGGESYKYSGSNNRDEVAWHKDNSGGQTQAVGQKKTNDFGLFDMTGNALEWCSDWWDREYYIYRPSNDPTGPAAGKSKVLRGGNWKSDDFYSGIGMRFAVNPAYRDEQTGFRVVVKE